MSHDERPEAEIPDVSFGRGQPADTTHWLSPEDVAALKSRMHAAYGSEHHERLGIIAPFWWNGWQNYLSSLQSIMAATEPLFERLERAYEQGAIDTAALSDDALRSLGLERIATRDATEAMGGPAKRAHYRDLLAGIMNPDPSQNCEYAEGNVSCQLLKWHETAHMLADPTGHYEGVRSVPLELCRYQESERGCFRVRHAPGTAHSMFPTPLGAE